ncbi:MAG: serine hydrolase domain-containing protein [Chitinophagaceae bacterium]
MPQMLLFSFALILNIVSYSQDFKNKSLAQIEKSLLPPVLIEGKAIKKMGLVERMKYYHVPGASITYIKKGKIVATKNYGLIDSNSNGKVNDSTLFQAGSISKAVTAVAIMTLVQKDEKLLDEDIFTYIKDWRLPKNQFYHVQPITARQLLSHSAGINVEAPF